MLKVYNDEIVRAHFQKVLKFARETGQLQNFLNKLNYLHNYGEAGSVKCVLYKDFAPMSFRLTFYRKQEDGTWKPWIYGGLIYHGEIDGYGSGSAPTFSVCVNETSGWSIHT